MGLDGEVKTVDVFDEHDLPVSSSCLVPFLSRVDILNGVHKLAS